MSPETSITTTGTWKSAARAWDVIETIEQLAPSSQARDGGLSVTTSPVVGGGQATETYPKRTICAMWLCRSGARPKFQQTIFSAEKQPASRGASRTVSAFSTLDSMSRLSAPCARVSLRLRSVMKCLACGL
jgi:hypothetical protein